MRKPRSPHKCATSAEIASVGEDAASTVSDGSGGASDGGGSLQRVDLGSPWGGRGRNGRRLP